MPDTTPIYLEEFLALHPADLADRLQRMDLKEARHILQELPVKMPPPRSRSWRMKSSPIYSINFRKPN